MRNDYTVIQKSLHWLMAGIIMLDIFVAQKYGNTMQIADRLESRVAHSTMGLLLLSLFVIRLVLRFIYGDPKKDGASPA
jgi:cytochrome b561